MKFLILSFLFSSYCLAILPPKTEDNASCLSLLMATLPEQKEYDLMSVMEKLNQKFPPQSRGSQLITDYLATLLNPSPLSKTYVFHFEDSELKEFAENWPVFSDVATSALLNHETIIKKTLFTMLKNHFTAINKFTKFGQFATPFLLFVEPIAAVASTLTMHIIYRGTKKGIKDTEKTIETLIKNPDLDPRKPKKSLARMVSTEVLNCGNFAEEKIAHIKGVIPYSVMTEALNIKVPSFEINALVFLSVTNKPSLTVILNYQPLQLKGINHD